MWNKMEPVHGKVEFHGFSHVMEEQLETAFNIDKIQEAFELFDSERKQYFDANDLDRVMRSLNEHLTMDQIKDMVRFFVSLPLVSFFLRARLRRSWRSTARATTASTATSSSI